MATSIGEDAIFVSYDEKIDSFLTVVNR